MRNTVIIESHCLSMKIFSELFVYMVNLPTFVLNLCMKDAIFKLATLLFLSAL